MIGSSRLALTFQFLIGNSSTAELAPELRHILPNFVSIPYRYFFYLEEASKEVEEESVSIPYRYFFYWASYDYTHYLEEAEQGFNSL